MKVYTYIILGILRFPHCLTSNVMRLLLEIEEVWFECTCGLSSLLYQISSLFQMLKNKQYLD